jgi:hypothetical protein
MMKNVNINYLHFCDAANIDSVGKISILGIFDKIYLAKLPSIFPKFSVVFSFTITRLMLNENKIVLKLYTPSGTELKLNQPIQIDFLAREQDKRKSGNLKFILDITNVRFTKYGIHTLKIYFNDKEMHITPLLLEERKK